MSRIVILAHEAESLINFRGELIKVLSQNGYDVIAMAPEQDYRNKVEEQLGVKYESINLDNTGMNPLKDLATIYDINKKLRYYKPDIIFSYAIKPVIYGGLAAKFCNVEKIHSLIPGAGQVFLSKNLTTKIISQLYKIGTKNNDTIFFQNPDDQKLFNDYNIININTDTYLVNGSGVKTDYYYNTEPKTDKISFLLMARLIRPKGIIEYIKAAEKINKKKDDIEFKLLGPFHSNPSALTETEIYKWHDNGTINYLGVKEDVRPTIENTSVFVLPSYYREGVPRSILEAMSMGKPIITTDSPGCRETVIDGHNGFLIPPKDIIALKNAMDKFIKKPNLIQEMGQKSRKIALEKYDVHKVNQFMIEKMGLE
ncbi:glycosyltransferase family 4 protein [Halanaerobium sp. Z-7514]|uniref:Glycosyltransferase family 4 protein n=1 Tax=Halanaerobium polyolivorans TaxID=2886943 RepID=A0AAW4X1I0_9FIRM|nr:glycosyltransferase family 4 protein [Halanaerobium polyolivorans]MCC3145669.1 glycosyltransferase family 4 protein [Halanaerobium polyolivorans]